MSEPRNDAGREFPALRAELDAHERRYVPSPAYCKCGWRSEGLNLLETWGDHREEAVRAALAGLRPKADR